MARAHPDPSDLAHVRPETRAVLATLCLAAVWPARYPDGWVSLDDFADVGLGLGGARVRQGLKASVRRGLRQYREAVGPLAIERRRLPESQGAAFTRERQLRIKPSPPQPLVVWFFGSGLNDVFPDKRNEFLQSVPTPATTVDETLSSIQGLLPQLWQSWDDSHDATDALWHLYNSTPASPARDTVAVSLLRMQLRIGPNAAPTAAAPIVAELVGRPRALSDLQSVLSDARIAIEHGFCIGLESLAWNGDRTASLRARQQCEALLSRPITVEAGLPAADRSRLHTLLALIALADASCCDASDRVEALRDAAGDLVVAFQNASAAGDVFMLIDIAYLMAEHVYLSNIASNTLPTEAAIDAVERAFIEAWNLMQTVCPTGKSYLQIAREASLDAMRGILRVQRKKEYDGQDLIDRSAYRLSLMENWAREPWQERLKEHVEKELAALWARSGLTANRGHYSIRGFYKADPPGDGESARAAVVEVDVSGRFKERPKQGRRIPERRGQAAASGRSKRKSDRKRGKS